MIHVRLVPIQRRGLTVVLTLVALSGCGGTGGSELRPSKPRTIELGWRESADINGREVLEFNVRSVELQRRRWTVHASVTNRSTIRFSIAAPARVQGLLGRGRRWTFFGLTWTSSPRQGARIIHAEGYRPELPKILEPGQTWSGSFTGPAFAVRGRPIRVTFGMFVPTDVPPRDVPAQIGWVTDHYLLVRDEPSEGQGS